MAAAGALELRATAGILGSALSSSSSSSSSSQSQFLSSHPSSWLVNNGSRRRDRLSGHGLAGRIRAVATRDPPRPVANGSSNGSTTGVANGAANGVANGAANGSATRGRSMKEMSQEMKRIRAQMEEDEQVVSLMRGLRGQNLSDELFASANTRMRLVEVDEVEGEEGLPQVYDPVTISAYWGKRPGSVATRIAQLLGVAGGFLSRIGWDIITKKVKQNEVKRAIELRDIVTSLGPAYIKLGQALSIRPDILSPSAMTELQKLCDKVPSFPNDVAMALIETELGKPWQEVYSELTESPIAAASLGQVYKGTLIETGETVAVKVQRPYVLETVTIDLFIIRRLGVALRRFPQIATDIVGLVDEWAARFFEELDYIHEGQNGTRFAEQMRIDLPQVVVPRTFPKYTSRRVLTTSWIEGEKLSQSTADDVGDLVNIGVICYLKQLLDTGLFHADPHPGNLIRTPEGKLAILDFGLMTQITDNQKYGMIEAISHLIHRDYEAIVADFVLLDFIPEGVNLAPIMPVLAKVFDQALEGGGAKNINFQDLAADLAQITFDYPFRIPPYFALIIRAIGVLEGIALVGNSDFAIVDEAYPYIAQRLLTDPSPRLREALRYTIYGRNSNFDAERFIDVMEAFESFTVAAKSGGGEELQGKRAFSGAVSGKSPAAGGSLAQQQQSGVQTRAALSFLISEQGEFFRDFILDEVVKGIDAVTREELAKVVLSLGLQRLDPFINSLLPPAFRKPVSVVPIVTSDDEVVLSNMRRILAFLSAGSPAARSVSTRGDVNISEMVRDLMPVLPDVARSVLPELVNRLSTRVAARTLREIFL